MPQGASAQEQQSMESLSISTREFYPPAYSDINFLTEIKISTNTVCAQYRPDNQNVEKLPVTTISQIIETTIPS
jgi:hypothetical protein